MERVCQGENLSTGLREHAATGDVKHAGYGARHSQGGQAQP